MAGKLVENYLRNHSQFKVDATVNVNRTIEGYVIVLFNVVFHSVGKELDAGCSNISPHDPCDAEYTCHMSEEKGLMCMEKCDHFMYVDGHCTKDFLTNSECILIGDDWDKYPYCE